MNEAQNTAGFAKRLKLKACDVPLLLGYESEPQVIRKLCVLCWQQACVCILMQP